MQMFSNALRSFAARIAHEGLWLKHRLHMLAIHTRCTRSQGLSSLYFVGSGANGLGGVTGANWTGGGVDLLRASISNSARSAAVSDGLGLHACTASAAPINIMPCAIALTDPRPLLRFGRLLAPHITTNCIELFAI